MSRLDHAAARELAGPYALDALDGDDLGAFERHLEGCADCRREVDELRQAAAALALAVEPVEPPPALRARILDEARAGADIVPLRRDRPRRRATWGLVAATAAAAAVVIIGLGIWAGSLSRSLDRERSARADERAALARGRPVGAPRTGAGSTGLAVRDPFRARCADRRGPRAAAGRKDVRGVGVRRRHAAPGGDVRRSCGPTHAPGVARCARRGDRRARRRGRAPDGDACPGDAGLAGVQLASETWQVERPRFSR